jgi:hypothetical protein
MLKARKQMKKKFPFSPKITYFVSKILHQDYENICADCDYNINRPQRRVR